MHFWAQFHELRFSVMLMGTIVYGVKYKLPEYMCTFLVAGGVSAFALFKVNTLNMYLSTLVMWGVLCCFCIHLVMTMICCAQSKAKSIPNPNAPLGYSLCFLNLALDGFTNATQDSISAK